MSTTLKMKQSKCSSTEKTDKTNYAITTPLLFYIYVYTAEIDQQTNYIKDDVTEYYFKIVFQ